MPVIAGIALEGGKSLLKLSSCGLSDGDCRKLVYDVRGRNDLNLQQVSLSTHVQNSHSPHPSSPPKPSSSNAPPLLRSPAAHAASY